MKIITTGTPNFVSIVWKNEGKIKDWVEWLSSFDNILDHPRFLSFFNNKESITTVYDMIDILYKLEVEMSKIYLEFKAMTDAKWIKYLEELDTIRDIMWPDIDIDITI